MKSLESLLDERSVLVCTGTGGVGKTTSAAALALAAAYAGKRSAVVTIDPAKRLADALGAGALSNDPQKIDGDWPGELWALMLDTKRTFDDLVRANAHDEDQAERIINNRFYLNVSEALSGTQEYMAMQKLHDLHADERFDVIIVDTPPTRNALAFLDAPRLLGRLLDNKIYRALTAPSRGVMKVVGTATQTFVRQLGRVVGGEVVDDTISFFQAFEGMEDGLRRRSDQVLELLRSDVAAFVLVASPRIDTITEARYFAKQLAENDLDVDVVVVNRRVPAFEVDALTESRRADLAPHRDLAKKYAAASQREDAAIAPLAKDLPDVPIVSVPLADSDIHDLEGLRALALQLLA